MSQQQRPIYSPLVGATLLSLLIGMFLFAWRRLRKSTPSTEVTKHSIETSSEDTLTYWTKEKMRDAKAMPLPQSNALGRKKHHTDEV